MRGIMWAGTVFEWWTDSRGELWDNSLTFELGTFGAEFRPDTSNLVDWAANWKTLDVTNYNAEYGYFAGVFRLEHDYTSSGAGAVPGEVFGVGEQVYVWVYQGGRELTATPDEWALIRNDVWKVPETHDPIALPMLWGMSFEEQDAVLGAPGETAEVMLDPAVAYLDVRQQMTAQPVPEPGGGVLVLLSLLTLSAVRRR